MSTIGFIGGSGIYEALPLNDVREVEYDTPYGEPSDAITIGEFGDTGKEVAFLPRRRLEPRRLAHRPPLPREHVRS